MLIHLGALHLGSHVRHPSREDDSAGLEVRQGQSDARWAGDLRIGGGADETRTRDLRRDRPAFPWTSNV
ncbi:MAG: hypothetical protein MZV63_66475 [Marinilabiliales bacterium]|nr:hypothetical protein [Marinilabiliales bacterium]